MIIMGRSNVKTICCVILLCLIQFSLNQQATINTTNATTTNIPPNLNQTTVVRPTPVQPVLEPQNKTQLAPQPANKSQSIPQTFSQTFQKPALVPIPTKPNNIQKIEQSPKPSKPQLQPPTSERIPSRKGNKTQSETQTSSPNQTVVIRTTLFVYNDGGKERNLDTYDVAKLTQEQKDVDKFIRNSTQIGNEPNLTLALGNGKQFRYRYESKTENAEKQWIIDVSAHKGQKNQTSSGGKSSSKYKIKGFNYIQNAKMSDEEIAEYNEIEKSYQNQMRKQQKRRKRMMREMQKQMYAFEKQRRMYDYGWAWF